MEVAQICGGRLIVMTPLYSIWTRSPREKQQAWSVRTKMDCWLQQSQTRSWPERTSCTTAISVVVSIVSKVIPSNHLMLCKREKECAERRGVLFMKS